MTHQPEPRRLYNAREVELIGHGRSAQAKEEWQMRYDEAREACTDDAWPEVEMLLIVGDV